MNKERRKAIADVAKQINDLIVQAQSLRDELETIRDEEQEYFDNMPESLQGGEKGEAAEQFISDCEEVIEALETIDVDTSSIEGA